MDMYSDQSSRFNFNTAKFPGHFAGSEWQNHMIVLGFFLEFAELAGFAIKSQTFSSPILILERNYEHLMSIDFWIENDI